MKRILLLAGLVVFVGFGVATRPGIVLCAFASGNVHESPKYEQLIFDARERIKDTFGAPEANPMVLFFDQEDAFWPLKLNPYGSTSYLGKRSCVFVGPEGQNTDVTAHELMHAEIAHRIDFKRRGSEWPIWFDEGLAMQVDFRDAYALPDSNQSGFVTRLKTGGEFFGTDNQRLTMHYAAARKEVGQWVAFVSKDSVYAYLARVKSGESFESIYFQQGEAK